MSTTTFDVGFAFSAAVSMVGLGSLVSRCDRTGKEKGALPSRRAEGARETI